MISRMPLHTVVELMLPVCELSGALEVIKIEASQQLDKPFSYHTTQCSVLVNSCPVEVYYS